MIWHHGGSLELVRTGDLVTIVGPKRWLETVVDHEELDARRGAWVDLLSTGGRRSQCLFCEHGVQADRGVELDFLVGSSSSSFMEAPF